MELRRMGNSGLTVSTVGLGGNNFGRKNSATEGYEGTAAVIHAALDAGITLFDTADMYGMQPGLSEEYVGRALRGHRDEVVIATKFGLDAKGINGPDFGARGSRRYIINAAEASLKRLGTDYIDLYLYHTPDPLTPVEETLSALTDLVSSGKVRYIGHSNMTGWQIAHAEHVARELGTERFVASQNHFNLLDRRAELEVLPASAHFGLGVLPYYPLANGLLTGKYTDGIAPDGSRLAVTKPQLMETTDFDQLKRYREFAKARGITELEATFGFLLASYPITSIIAGVTRPEQVTTNAESASWVPTQEDMDELDEIFPPAPKVALF
ncbi:aldo/keto reductase [Flaviflexus salsibiostraticola]|uniref:Aldo/keto reductase n=2 Tax=Flaviflexus salsibiostraticola TaxID=1282737 RepID=A0A3Q8WU89_9ACTO|nr:aldo/keto reductase [Flaviflexus salsibiostraticola]